MVGTDSVVERGSFFEVRRKKERKISKKELCHQFYYGIFIFNIVKNSDLFWEVWEG